MDLNVKERGNSLIVFVVALALLGVGAYFLLSSPDDSSSEQINQPENQNEESVSDNETDAMSDMTDGEPVTVTPISHATMVMNWDDVIIYTDPVGGAEAFAGQPDPDLILLTDTHGDHLSIETLEAIVVDSTVMVVPQAVMDELPESLASQATVMNNGDEVQLSDFYLVAMPMYNLPEQGVEIRHEKGVGNGYLVSKGDYQVYIAGDTADIPEMRELTDIDLAFVPMNLPYTMGVERAADGVLAFAPSVVVPYHFRTPEGFSDVVEFGRLVNEENSDIEVRYLDWYPDTEEDVPADLLQG